MVEKKWSLHGGADTVSVAYNGYSRFDITGPMVDRYSIGSDIVDKLNSHASLVEEVERLRGAVALAVSGKNLMDGVPSVTISREAYDAMLAAIGETP